VAFSPLVTAESTATRPGTLEVRVMMMMMIMVVVEYDFLKSHEPYSCCKLSEAAHDTPPNYFFLPRGLYRHHNRPA
jgi:hypothetical protein